MRNIRLQSCRMHQDEDVMPVQGQTQTSKAIFFVGFLEVLNRPPNEHVLNEGGPNEHLLDLPSQYFVLKE